MPERAWPLYQMANELQPGIPLFQGNLAACVVYLGKIEEAGLPDGVLNVVRCDSAFGRELDIFGATAFHR